jgi:hypothetical protein
MGIETNCSFAVPKDTWTDREMHKTTQEEKDSPLNSKNANLEYPSTPFLEDT